MQSPLFFVVRSPAHESREYFLGVRVCFRTLQKIGAGSAVYGVRAHRTPACPCPLHNLCYIWGVPVMQVQGLRAVMGKGRLGFGPRS